MDVQAQMRTGARRGFTLIELVVVLAILAAIAGLVIPQIDGLRRSSDKGTASHTIGSLSMNTQLYRTLKGNYPNRFDSLVEGTAKYAFISSKVSGALTLAQLDEDTVTIPNVREVKSLADVGITRLMNHVTGTTSAGQTLPGNTGVTEVTLADGVDVLTLTNTVLTGDNEKKRNNMVRSIYPSGTIPAGVKILIVGVGQNCTAIGQTMLSAPSYQGVDANTTYNRYFLAFAVYSTGKRARLIGSFDSTGDYLTQEVDEFNENSVE